MDVVTLGMAKAAADQRYQKTIGYSEDIGNNSIALGSGALVALTPRIRVPATTQDVWIEWGGAFQVTAAGAGGLLLGPTDITAGSPPSAFTYAAQVSGGFTAGTWSAFWQPGAGRVNVGHSSSYRVFRLYGFVGRDTSSTLAASFRASGASPFSSKPWMRASCDGRAISNPATLRIGVGNVQAGTYDYLWLPKNIRGASKYGVILPHGASTTSDFEIDGVGWPAISNLAWSLAEAGIPVIAAYMNGNNFGIDAACGTSGWYNTALAYMAAQTGCSAAKMHAFGVSMGGGGALRWGALNPSKCASVGGIVPAVSTQHLYTDNPNDTLINGFPQLISSAWGLAYRTVTDAITTSGSTTVQSATAAFTSADVGRQITRSWNNTGGIPANTTIVSVTDSSHAVMSNAATSSASSLPIGIYAPLPMSGDSGADLIGHFAPALAANSIPNRWYYTTGDPYIYPTDVTAAATAAGGTAIQVSTSTGHSNATAALVDTWNGGSNFSDLIAWFIANGS